jgi:hypothetical protein
MDWSWAGPPLDTRPLFPLERAEFVTLLRSLGADDWPASAEPAISRWIQRKITSTT